MNKPHIFSFIALLVIMMSVVATAASAELIVNKYTNGFSASTPNNEQIKLCACETKIDRVIVENTGQFYADFHVAANTAYPAAVNIPKQDFQLAPGHFQEVLVYIEDSCGLQGEFPYSIVVTNSYGRVQTIDRSIRVDMCQTGALEVTPAAVTAGLCKSATYQATVKNVGTYADSYALDFGPYNDAATLANKAVYLTPGQSYTQNVTFTFACSDYGTKVIPFLLSTGKNGPAASTTRNLEIVNQYNYGLEFNSNAAVCAKTTTVLPFTVQNAADAPDTIFIDTNAPRFVSIPKEFSLEAKESKTLNITVGPAQPGTYAFSVLGTDRYGGVQKSRDMTLTVNNCFDVTAEMRVSPTEPLTAPLATCCGPKTFFVNVRNNGDRAQAFELRVDGPSYFTLDETTVRLEPGQNINVPLRATLPCADERIEAVVVVYPIGQSQINSTARIVIDSQTIRTCHMVQIDDDELVVKETAQVIPLIVKHTGSEAGNYTITSNSTLFTVQETEMFMQPGDQRAVHLVPVVNLTSQEKGRYIVMPTFTLRAANVQYNEEVGVFLRGKNFIERFTDWLGGMNCSAVGACGWAVTVLFIAVVVAIVALVLLWSGKTLFPDGLSRKTLTMLKTLIVVLVFLFLVLLVFVPAPSDSMRYERVANSTNSTVIEWYQNELKSLDVSQYFADPDKDSLSYTVTQPRDVKATLDGTTLLLTPDHNFIGENTLVITADDHKGGMTDSPLFVLRVIPRKNLSFWQWVEQWCAYLLIFEMIALLIIAFLCVLTIKEHRPRPYADNVLVVVNGKPKTKTSAKRKTGKAAPRVATRVSRASTASRSRALVPLPSRKAFPVARAVTRGRQVAMRGSAAKPVLREYKGTGQTVNIAVAPQAAPSPAVVAVPGFKPTEIVYVGAKGGNTVHTPYCMNARRIPRNKRVAFTTKKEAINAGLVPCRLCRPFEGGI